LWKGKVSKNGSPIVKAALDAKHSIGRFLNSYTRFMSTNNSSRHQTLEQWNYNSQVK